MIEQEVPTTVAQCIIIRFLANKGVKPTEILTRLQAEFGDDALSRIQVFDWIKKFRSGHDAVKNKSHERRPRSNVTENIQAVRKLVEDERRLTVVEISSKVGISTRRLTQFFHADNAFVTFFFPMTTRGRIQQS